MSSKIPPDAFSFYVTLGPGRSYTQVANHYDVDKRTVTRHAVSEGWSERLEEVERIAREQSEERAIDALREMNERHLKIAKALQGKALEAIRTMKIGKAADAMRALELGVKQERLIMGEASERSVVSVEETTKKEMDRWLTNGPVSTN